MSLVSNAWGVFGAAFSPAILLSLYWKRFTFAGAVAGKLMGMGVIQNTFVMFLLGIAIGGLIMLVIGANTIARKASDVSLY